MPKAAIVAFQGCYASSMGGFADVLQVVNAHLRQQHGNDAKFFEWSFVSLSGEGVRTSNGLLVETTRLDPRTQYDLIFIPSLHHPGRTGFEKLLKVERPLHSWLKFQWDRGAWLAANCTGTFILADTGLLNGRIATTTWWLEQQFKERFPAVDLELDSVVTEADRLICAGAYASYLLQAVRVIERFSGPVIASLTAKTMLIDVSQTTQAPYLPLMSDKAHGDTVVHKAQHWLQRHMAKDLRIVDLASALNVSERTLIRHFKSALGQAPLSYLQSLRLDAARSLLEAGDLPVEKVAQRVGYADTSSFSRLFRQKVGLSPGAYRTRFQTTAQVEGAMHVTSRKPGE